MQIMQIGDAVNTVIMQMRFFRNADRAHGVGLLPRCPRAPYKVEVEAWFYPVPDKPDYGFCGR